MESNQAKRAQYETMTQKQSKVKTRQPRCPQNSTTNFDSQENFVGPYTRPLINASNTGELNPISFFQWNGTFSFYLVIVVRVKSTPRTLGPDGGR